MTAQDILSQDEIDALLHGVDSGAVDTTPPPAIASTATAAMIRSSVFLFFAGFASGVGRSVAAGAWVAIVGASRRNQAAMPG